MSATDVEPAASRGGAASSETLAGVELDGPARIKEILAAVKPLAAEYYRLRREEEMPSHPRRVDDFVADAYLNGPRSNEG